MCGFLSSQDEEFNEGEREEKKRIIGFWKAEEREKYEVG
jgi:hypothetical protein